jgi:hypothetical protein
MMMNKKIILLLLAILLIGCQQAEEVSQEYLIEIGGSGPVIEEIDEEFNDGLDQALLELEEIENIA